MNRTGRTFAALAAMTVGQLATLGVLACAAANDPHRLTPDQPAVTVADTTDRPITWRPH
jgi:hypothetical protein